MEYMGYVYRNTETRPNGLRLYVCDVAGCYATAKKTVHGRVTLTRPHTHRTSNRSSAGDNTNTNLIETIAFKAALRAKVNAGHGRLIDIYRSEAVNYPMGAANYPWTSACSLMTRIRKTGFPAAPNTFAELDNLFRTGALNRFCVDGRNMYRGFFTNEVGKSIAIFACHALVDLVLRQNPTNMYVDQTFRIIPPKPRASQLLTVHFEIDSCSFPVIYCLMEDESPTSYYHAIRFIKESVLFDYCPRNIFSDINLLLISPLGYYFPTASLDCTWFQHNQIIYEHMIKFGYSNLIMDSGIAFRCLKMLMALPLLPPNKIITGFEEVKAYAYRMQVHIPKIFDYYNLHWLHQIGTNSMSIYLKPTKTINNLEMFHKKLNRSFRTLPTIWTFLSGIYNLNSTYVTEANRLSQGGFPTKSFRCQLMYNHFKIRTHTHRLMEGNLMIKDFILLCSESLNSYEEHLKCWTVKISMNWAYNQSVNGERFESDVDAIEPEFEMSNDTIHEYIEQFQRQSPEEEQQQHQQQQSLQSPQSPQSPQQQQEQNEFESTVDYKVHSPASPETDDDQSSEIHGFCMVCLTTKHERKYLIVPCGHTWVCQKCRDQDLKTCPYCRDEIQLFVRVLETSV
uniref:RING-type domain-containing protein n=1 Tax=Schizaphis graminum TaxID=13262 RepID=A0A2S2PAB2_SCHGA